jgi:putative addiction module component (TIGR02574 family)
MSENIEAVFTAALALPPETRATLAERLLDSLKEEGQSEIDAAWAEEARKRLEAFDRGELKGVPAEEVMKSLRIRNQS